MRSKLLLLLTLAGGGVALVISLYHLAYVQKIYPFTFVGPVAVSNLTISRAETKINQELAAAPATLNLIFGDQNWPVNLAELAINYDPLLSAQSAYVRGRSDNFFSDLKLKFRQWQNPVTLPLIFTFDQSKLEAIINQIRISVDEEPIQPALILNQKNQIELIPGRNGRVVDKEQLLQELNTRLGYRDFSPLPLPIRLISVNVGAEQLLAAEAAAQKLKDQQLELIYENFSHKLQGQKLLDLINLHEGDFDEEKISRLTAELAQKLDRPAQNPAFKFDGTRVVEFKPALPGLTLNQAVTDQLIINALEQLVDSGQNQTVDLVVNTVSPANSLSDINSLGIKELLGQGESTFRGSIPSRKHNLALAAERVNGLLIPPGETFSFNQTVGDVSRAAGFQAAYIIKDGRTVLGDGGGICQVSTTLFRAALNAGLEIVERQSHSYRVGYYEQNAPAGLDATVFAPSVDFKFKNDTANHILIQATTDLAKHYLKFELYGTSDGRRATITNFRLWAQTSPPDDLYLDDPTLPAGQIKQVDWKAAGGKAAFDWLVVRNDAILQQKTFYSSYRPWQAVFLRGTGG
jgi:vancomycin resistance protein YoaR